MKPSKLFNTRLFRLSLLYSVFIAAGASILLGAFVLYAQSQLVAQVDAGLISEARALHALDNAEGRSALARTLSERRHANNDDASDAGDRFYAIAEGNQGILISGTRLALPAAAASTPLTITSPQAINQKDGDAIRRLRVMVVPLRNGGTLAIAQSLNEIDELKYAMLAALLFSVVAVLASGFVGGTLISRKMVNHLYSVTSASEEIMRGNLDKRLTTGSKPDEFDDLACVINSMLDRIQTLIEDTREANTSIAHDLRTPLARLRGRLESLHANAGTVAVEQSLSSSIEELDKLIATFNSLMIITGLESGTTEPPSERVDLGSLATDIIDLYGALAEERSITIETSLSKAVYVHGSRNLLAQSISNLVDNAIKYTTAGGKIDISVQNNGGTAVFSISDNGPGIPDNLHPQVIKRFYRMDSSRSTPGNGLGLSLVAAVIRLHDGELVLQDLKPGLSVALKFQAI